MPPYPDDAGAPRLDIALDPSNEGSSPNDKNSVTLFDTGAGKRNRQAGVRRYHRGQKDTMWQREQLNERRLSLIDRGEVDTTFITGVSQSPSHSNVSDDVCSSDNLSPCTSVPSNLPLSLFSTQCTLRRAE